MRATEALGRAIGGVLSPITGEGSLLRRARLFHPDGVLFRADVRPLAREGAVGELAQRLAGPALVRLSSAWWRHEKELPDALGIAVRFCGRMPTATSVEASARDQDLLFATFQHIWSLPFAPLTTNVHDFLGNQYHAILPFYVLGLGRVKFRLMPSRQRQHDTHGSRRERLERAVAAGNAVLRLEVAQVGAIGARLRSPEQILRMSRWQAVAVIDLEERSLVDQEALSFTPFHAGRGIMPIGPFQMMRAATYAASRTGRKVASIAA
ncbi:hypothetical protein [Polyangium sp. y55x31]|uniref:hypothetical protein n=1 Tax=Polyangium sp. y55x31 TaxID=3042688 RepID=UPI0024826F31|nr:hypothetical protein [Polyangium sp. y55x31]MDI1475804.1 hypothetical protein [Polyangium sp. y55x31]